MKKLFFFCLISISINASLLAQTLPRFDQIKLEKRKDFKLADSAILQTSNYLLSTPISKDTSLRLRSAQFLMKWMDGTTDYTFTLDENSTKYFINDTNLMAVYMAALCKTALQYKPGVLSKKITVNAIKLLLAYANNRNNNVAWTEELKKLSKANDKGDLENFLNL